MHCVLCILMFQKLTERLQEDQSKAKTSAKKQRVTTSERKTRHATKREPRKGKSAKATWQNTLVLESSETSSTGGRRSLRKRKTNPDVEAFLRGKEIKLEENEETGEEQPLDSRPVTSDTEQQSVEKNEHKTDCNTEEEREQLDTPADEQDVSNRNGQQTDDTEALDEDKNAEGTGGSDQQQIATSEDNNDLEGECEDFVETKKNELGDSEVTFPIEKANVTVSDVEGELAEKTGDQVNAKSSAESTEGVKEITEVLNAEPDGVNRKSDPDSGDAGPKFNVVFDKNSGKYQLTMSFVGKTSEEEMETSEQEAMEVSQADETLRNESRVSYVCPVCKKQFVAQAKFTKHIVATSCTNVMLSGQLPIPDEISPLIERAREVGNSNKCPTCNKGLYSVEVSC